MRARLVVGVAAVVACFVAASPVAADDRPPGGGAYIDDSGSPTASAGDGSGSAGSGGSSGGGGAAGDQPCEWRVSVEDDLQFAVYSADTLETQHSATGRWLQYWCEGYGVVDVNGYYATPEGGLVDPAALAQEALESVDIEGPAIRTSPSEDGRLFVQVPTWLWIDRGWWHTYTATAEAGRVWAKVSARPTGVSWDLGDGASVSCGGPGEAWHPGAPEDGSSCSHTYVHASEGHALSATVELEVSWTSNVAAGGGLSPIGRTSTIEVEVGEIQAVGSSGGGAP